MITGQWKGIHRLFLRPNDLTDEGRFNILITNKELDSVLAMEYKHSIEQKDYSGIFLISFLDEDKCEAAWIDQFHTASGVMKFTGNVHSNGFNLEGGYQAGNDYWKWTIKFSFEENDFRINHFNHPPKGDKYLGDEIILKKT